ncbi:prolactin-inducible protein [Fukomys damarensis]|uniref:Prolactin-inducible protein homolog n=1 Tax=Fukomys damarensis TaxID=885580 RepID=A0A091CUD7_FUKDA|nr:prolactin-inducible protein [Fukomys damarensis]KFO22102.1 Prolactin-inducible protein like protein [Fukomys damarensis]
MFTLQLLFRASPAALLLVLCLQLGISTAQEDTRRAIILNMDVPQTASAGEEITLKLNVQTELRECMVIKTYLISSTPIDGAFNYKYTSCLCDDYPRNFYWDFQINRTVKIAAVVDIVRELNICPEDKAVVPIWTNRVYALHTLYIY